MKFEASPWNKRAWAQLIAFIGFVLILAGLINLVVSSRLQVILIFQNSDEIRATGGFFGSLAIIKTHGLGIESMHWHDVYELDDQIAEYLPAPVAVQRYLSSGHDTLHLQDANWERDFPSSMKAVSTLLERARVDRADAIVAINSTLVQRLLDFWTEQGLDPNFHDFYGDKITSENFTTLARRDHSLLATPRQPKTRFLRYFGEQLLVFWRQLDFKQQMATLKFLAAQKSDRLYQIYTEKPWLETLIRWIGASGETSRSWQCETVYLVPSNVGINKSNRYTTQTIANPEITIADQESTASVTLQIVNNAPLLNDVLLLERSQFADYQRVLLSPEATVSAIVVNGEPVRERDERIIVDARGQTWREVGFFLMVEEQNQASVTLEIQSPRKCWYIRE